VFVAYQGSGCGDAYLICQPSCCAEPVVLDTQTQQTDAAILLRFAVALVLGAAIGWERDAAGKAAGLRTCSWVSRRRSLSP
jgi:hypothetical protein